MSTNETDRQNELLDIAASRISLLEETLAFYADPDTYFAIAMMGDPPCGMLLSDLSECETDGGSKVVPGMRARIILGHEVAQPSPPAPTPEGEELDLTQFEGHTPGPWPYVESHPYYGDASRTVWKPKGPGYGAVATVTEVRDARLIAAAPALLSYARDLRQQLVASQEIVRGYRLSIYACMKERDEARSTVSKLEGERDELKRETEIWLRTKQSMRERIEELSRVGERWQKERDELAKKLGETEAALDTVSGRLGFVQSLRQGEEENRAVWRKTIEDDRNARREAEAALSAAERRVGEAEAHAKRAQESAENSCKQLDVVKAANAKQGAELAAARSQIDIERARAEHNHQVVSTQVAEVTRLSTQMATLKVCLRSFGIILCDKCSMPTCDCYHGVN